MGNGQTLGRVGKYKLLKELNSTGNSSVYLAIESEFHAPVALKVFTVGDETSIESEEFFLDQFRISQRVSSKFFVKTLEVNDSPKETYAVMEFNPGRSLREMIDSGDLSIKNACRIIVKVGIAANALHEAGTTHLNIHPGNILIREDGSPCLVGIGSQPNFLSQTTEAQTIKPASELVYLAPESFSEHDATSQKSDLYSLGIILYEAITGQVPFHADSVDKLVDQITKTSPKSPARLVKEIKSPLAAICLKAIQKQPNDRHVSVRQFSQELKTFLKNDSVQSKKFKPSKRTQTMFSSQQKLIAGIVCSLSLILILGIAFLPDNFFQEEEPEVVEVVEKPVDLFETEKLQDWSQEQFLDSFEKNELSAAKWMTKLKDFPDTEEAALTLVRFFNASVANPDRIANTAKNKVMEFDAAGTGGLGAAPSITPDVPAKVLRLIHQNSSALTFEVLQSIALNQPHTSIDVAEDIPNQLRTTAASMVLQRAEELPPKIRCQLSFRKKVGKPAELLAAIPIDENLEKELKFLKVLMEEFIKSPPANGVLDGGSLLGGNTGNGYAKNTGQLALVNRLANLNQASADEYLFELMELKAKGNKKHILPTAVQAEIVERFIEKDDNEIVITKLAHLIADHELKDKDSGIATVSSKAGIQFQVDSFGPNLRENLIKQFWSQESIQQDRLLDLVPFHHSASLLALKHLYRQSNLTADLSDFIENKIAQNALHSSGTAIGWIPASPALEHQERTSRSAQSEILLGSAAQQGSYRGNRLQMTAMQQPLIHEWLDDEELLQQIVKRMEASDPQRTILLDILASSAHSLARAAVSKEIARFANVGPEEFAGQPIALAKTPEDIASLLSKGSPARNNSTAKHQGWADPWMILVMKEPKRIRPPQKNAEEPRSAANRKRPTANKKPTSREVQQAWFAAVRETVEAWHDRCRLAISHLPPGAPELSGALEEFSIDLPEEIHVRSQAHWDSNENSRGLVALPEGHRMAFIEFDSKEHPKRIKQLLENVVPSELSLGDDGWTDSTVQEAGVERNFDILYKTESGLTQGTLMILERPLPTER